MVMASYYVQVQELTWASLYASLPVGLLVANILHANNVRDIENDRQAGKLTIAGLVGRPAADYILYALVIAAYSVVGVCAATDGLSPWALLVVFSLPATVTLLQKLEERDPGRMNPLVRGASMVHLQFGALLALGFLVAALTEA
jgi:1,4-dihydroxy-2-naphthoate polyprenyltransferase